MLAIVLARNNIKEFDQVVSLYTREHGKLEALAKGIKKIVSKNSANLEIFSLVDIEIEPGKGMDYLTKVQSVKLFKNIYADFDKIWLAGYAVKIINENLLVGEKDERVFDLLLGFLEFLNSATDINYLNLATGFIFKFWHCLGFSSQEEKHQIWLQEDWPIVNNINLIKEEQIKIFDTAIKFATYHSGKAMGGLFTEQVFDR